MRFLSWLSRHERRVLITAALAAVIVRVVYAFGVANARLTDDETSFWAIAGNVAEGRGYSYEGTATAWRPPLYTGFIAVLRDLGFEVREVQAVQAVLGAATALLLFAIARRLRLPDWAALAAGAAGALYPPFVHLSSQILSENLSVPLLLGAVWATLVALPLLSWRALVACGGVWALAALTRPAALAGLAVAVGAVAVARSGWATRAGSALVMLATAGAVMAPWTIRNADRVGGVVPVVSNESFTLWVANRLDTDALKDVFRDPRYPGLEDYGVYGRAFPGIAASARADGFDFARASEARRDRWFRGLVTDDVRDNPIRFVRRSIAKTVAVLGPAPGNASREERTSTSAKVVLWLTSGPLIVAGIAGMGGLAWRNGVQGWFLAITALSSLVGVAIHLPYVRYRVGAVDPLLVVGAAWLISRFSSRLERNLADGDA